MENQRVRLTKYLLKNSLIKLSKKKSLHKISVTELCKEAQINRSTFYVHYGSQYDVLRDIENDLIHDMKEILQKNTKRSLSINKEIELLCDYLKDNKEIAKLVYSNNSSDSEFARKSIGMRIENSVFNDQLKKYSEEQKKLVYTFYTNGIYSVIKQWLMEDFNMSSKDIGLIGEKFTQHF